MAEYLNGRDRFEEFPVNGEQTPSTIGKDGVEQTRVGSQWLILIDGCFTLPAATLSHHLWHAY